MSARPTPQPSGALAHAARLLAALLPAAFVGLLFLYPLAAILRLGLSAGALAAVLGDPYYLGVLWFSLWLGGASAALTLAAGMPVAYAVARFRFPGRRPLRALATAPFVLPTVVVAAGFSALLGPAGLAGELARALGARPPQLTGTLGAVLAAHVFYNLGLVVRLAGGMWQSVDPRLEQAAATLGASPWQVFRRVTLPLILPGVGAAALLTFIFSFGSFGVVLLIGGARMATLEVEVYRQTTQALRLDVAAALALLQAAVTLAAGWLYGRLLGRGAARSDLRARREALRPPRGRERLLVLGAAALVVLLTLPLPALALRSLTLPPAPGAPPALTLDYYALLGQSRRGALLPVPPIQAVANSLGFALAATALALAAGLPAAFALARARRRWAARLLDSLVTLPLGVSAVMVGLGTIVAWGPAGVLGSPLLVPAAHALLAFPFVVRSLAPAIRGLSPRVREAAATLGAGPLRTLLAVELPLLAPALLSATLFSMTVSLGDFGAALLLSRPEYPTVPTAIGRLLGQPGAANYGQALALGTIMMLVSVGAFLLLERLRPEGVGEI